MPDHGKKITQHDANQIVQKFISIANNNRAIISGDCKNRGDNDAAIYYNDEVSGFPANCYVFDTKFIKEFMDSGATQLLVLPAAQTDTANIVGTPTMVIVGCTMDESSGKQVFTAITTQAGDYAAVEHPPCSSVATLPAHGPIIFSVDI